MITGGYNIIDFGGEVFNAGAQVDMSDEVLNKLIDTSKPVLIGNFAIISGDFNTGVHVNPCFAHVSMINNGESIGIIAGVVIIEINYNTKTAVFQLRS